MAFDLFSECFPLRMMAPTDSGAVVRIVCELRMRPFWEDVVGVQPAFAGGAEQPSDRTAALVAFQDGPP